jgi:DNA-binding transcriptional LysR family regulator
MASLTQLPAAITRFRAAHPAVVVTAEPATSSEQLDALRAGRCDVAFVPMATTRQDLAPLAHRAICTSPLVALVSAKHRLANRRWIRLEDLAGEAFAFLAEAGEPRLNVLFRRRCQQAGFDPNIVLEVEHSDVLVAFVAAGYAVSYVPELVLELGMRGVVALPVRPQLHGGIVAVWNPALISAAGRRFLDTLPR